MAKRTEPYIPGEQLEGLDIIKLNTNENPYPPSPKVVTAITAEMQRGLQLYPSATAQSLRAIIAKRNGLQANQVFIGNGSDEVLAFSFMAFFEPGQTIRFPAISYSFYPVYAKLFDLSYDEIPLSDDFTLLPELFSNSEGGVILPNPNAPTSIYADLSVIESILQTNPDRIVIIDEAYIDFATKSAVELIDTYSNLLVIQTTSKSRSLAGLRVGFAMGHPSLIEALFRIKDSFNSYTIDRLALVGAQAAFEDTTYFKERTAQLIATRENVKINLVELGFTVLPSQTNFVFITHESIAADVLYSRLKTVGILTRHFPHPAVENYLRVTIGTEQQMTTLIKEIKKISNE